MKNSEILVVITLIMVLITFVLLLAKDYQRPSQKFVVEEGPYVWEVYVGGSKQTWRMAYRSYSEVPFKYFRAKDVIVYKGQQYNVWRVYSNQIQVSAPIK